VKATPRAESIGPLLTRLKDGPNESAIICVIPNVGSDPPPYWQTVCQLHCPKEPQIIEASMTEFQQGGTTGIATGGRSLSQLQVSCG
jgi:hypothetical protein